MEDKIKALVDNISFRKLAIVFLLLISPVFFAPFHADDYFQLLLLNGSAIIERGGDGSLWGLFSFVDTNPAHRLQMLQYGALPWFSSADFFFRFWRPVAEITHWLDFQLVKNNALFAHLHNLVWFFLVCFIVQKLFSRTMADNKIAKVIALGIFVLDGQHTMTINWIANRSALLATFFSMLALYSHMIWREEKQKSHFLVALFSMILALCSSELAIAVTAFFFFYALFLDPAIKKIALLNILPYAFLVLIWLLMYRQSGFGANAGNGLYKNPLVDFSGFLSAVVAGVPVYFSAAFLPVPAGLVWIGGSEYGWVGKVFAIFSALFFVITMPLVWRLLKGRKVLAFWFWSGVFCVMPLCSALPQDRLAIIQTVGIDAFLGMLVAMLLGMNAENTHRGYERKVSNCAIAILLMHLFLSPHYLFVSSLVINHSAHAVIDNALHFNGDISLKHKEIVSLKMPVGEATAMIGIREFFHQDLPDSFLWLTDDQGELKLTVLGERDLLLEKSPEFIGSYEKTFRLLKHSPFHLGEKVIVPAGEIEIRRIKNNGHPDLVRLHLNKSINDGRILFFTQINGRLESIKLPEIGHSAIY